jgi:tetratricopeptide (TPR) repeat protein
VVLMESEKDSRKTSDEAPLRRGGGKNSAPLALPQQPALNLFQGRLLWPVLALGGLLLLSGCATDRAQKDIIDFSFGNQGVVAGSEEELREIIRMKPDQAEAHYSLGLLLGMQKRLSEAETEFRETIRLGPNIANAYYNLGRVCGEQKKYGEAETAFRVAIRLNPTDVSALIMLALSLDKQGKRKEARSYWERAEVFESRPVVIEHIQHRLAEPD